MITGWKFCLLYSICFIFVSTAHAHKLNLFAFEEDGQIFVEGYFSSGIKPKGGKIVVLDNTGKVLFQGETDKEGGYIFAKPNVNEYRIELDAGLGHKTALGMKAGEIISQEEDQALGNTAHLIASGSHNESEKTSGTSGNSAAEVSNEQLKSIIKQAVAEATRPLAREISELKTKTKLSDIVGGIGFIFGMLGIFAYLKARKG